MSLKNVFGEDHAKLYVKYRPVPPPSLVARSIEFLREKYDGPLNRAVDLGCGNGQCTFPWASKFSSVLGLDLSPAQISEARELCRQMKMDNVEFDIFAAENIPLPDNSIQLITICKAAQWMDLPKVYDEAKRVLVKNGVFAIIGYWGPLYTPIKNLNMKDPINKIVEKDRKSVV